ncbi:MAG: hypothetical protein HKO64_11895 [Xanthomonadales bacterium]|nr:hypothetical protein [Xanthomonadales bacterium]NNL96314.1 hypothetical protein [Xanthomonadales bacterium]
MRIVLTVVLCAVFSNALAEAVRLSAVESFEAEKQQILKDLDSITIYREISGGDMKLVKDTLDRMSDNLSGVADLSMMTEAQRAQLYTDQELVNTVLTMAENDSRMVCKRRGRLGTNFKVTTCETVRDRRERQEADRRAIDSLIRGRPIDSN